MKNIIETDTWLYFDAEELAAIEIVFRDECNRFAVQIYLRGNSKALTAAEFFKTREEAIAYCDKLIKEAWGVE